ncbi:MAG: hypothetical protein ABIJ61_10325, partial [bacterium]
MADLFLIHWNAAEAQERLAELRKHGFAASWKQYSPVVWKELQAVPPDAILIDLTRIPSHGRDVAMSVRNTRKTRHLPIIFVEGDPAKVEKIKSQLPDAVYTSWRGIRSAVKKAIANSPADPVVPTSSLAGYSGTPLPQKLGIKPEMLVILVNAPEDFEQTLGKLPKGATLRRQLRGRSELVIWFAKSQSELERRLQSVLSCLTDRGGLWIACPKKASGLKSDLTPQLVREFGLARGLVDHKIAAIDDTWSGLRFV